MSPLDLGWALCALDLEWTCVCFGSGMTACALDLDSTVFAFDLDWDVVVSVLNFAALLFLNWLELNVPQN